MFLLILNYGNLCHENQNIRLFNQILIGLAHFGFQRHWEQPQ